MCDKRLCVCRKKQSAMTADDEDVKKLEAAFEEYSKIETHSLLKKHLTREVFDKLKTRVTSYGATLMDVIQSGLANPESHVGLYAPDPEAYVVFGALFDPVIEEYHGGFRPDDVHPNLDWGDPEGLGVLDPDEKYIISTRIRCARTISGYPFNPVMNEAHYREVEDKVRTALSSLDGELQGTYYSYGDMDPATRQQLVDDHILFKEGDRFLDAAKAFKHWPIGRGIFLNEPRSFIVWCNEEDHMRLISMEKGGDLGAVYSRLIKAATEIEKHFKFSRDRRFGFLSFCPTNLGTTIRASVHIKLPKLSGDYAKFEELANMYGLQIRGTRGEHTESEGGVYDISNRRRLGVTERDVVFEMRNGIVEMIKQEKYLEGMAS